MAILAGQTAFYYLAAASIASAILAVTREIPSTACSGCSPSSCTWRASSCWWARSSWQRCRSSSTPAPFWSSTCSFVMLLDLPGEEAGPRFGAHWPLVRRRRARLRGPGVVRREPRLVPTAQRVAAGGLVAGKPLGGRHGALHPVRAALRDCLPHASGRHRGRGRSRQEKDTSPDGACGRVSGT